MANDKFRKIGLWHVAAFLPLAGAAVAAEPLTLSNRGLTAQLDPASGRIVGVENRLTGERLELAERTPFDLVVDGRALGPGELTLAEARTEGDPRFVFRGESLEIALGLRLPPDRDFLEKTLRVTNRGTAPVRLDRVRLIEAEFPANRLFVHPHRDPSVYAWLIDAFLRGERGGLYAGIENPFAELVAPSGRVELVYAPRWTLAPGETFVSEPAFLGAYKKEGIYAFKELGRLARAVRAGGTPPLTMRLEQEVLDWGEVWAMQEFVEALQPPPDYGRPGYYLRAIGPAGSVSDAKAFADFIAALGHVPHIEWNSWVTDKDSGAPSLIARAADGHPRIEPNEAWREIADYARSKGIRSGTMEAVPNPFYGAREDWLVRDAGGRPWGDGRTVCLADPRFMKAYLDAYDRLVRERELCMLAWDSPTWMWLRWPEPVYECHATGHGHSPGDVRYAVWRNLMDLFAGLRERHSKLALRVAAGLQPGYPWILKDLMEHHTSFYDNEPGGSWWRSRNTRFIPAYKCATTMVARSWPYLRYNFFRSLSIADHAMIWGVLARGGDRLRAGDDVYGQWGLPMEDDQRAFFRTWMDWADRNVAYLRVRRDLFREPWGDAALDREHVDMEGNFPWPDPQLHGSAHCIGDRGFVFLFNPSRGTRVAALPVNHWLGLAAGDRFAVNEIFPDEARRHGAWGRGDTCRIAVPPGTAMVLEIAPAGAGDVPAAPSPPADAPVDKAFYAWDEIPWREIDAPP